MSQLYFRQLLAGRDFARDDAVARSMVNFLYVIGDRDSGEALLVDPAYGPAEVIDLLAQDDMTVVGALATHYHPDHVGGEMSGHSIAGITSMLAVVDVPIHVHREEVPWIVRRTGVSETALVAHDSSDVVTVGDIEVTMIHTPGHTPGSTCFLVDGRLLSGDTLFLEGCGRTDLPGGDPAAMYDTLVHRLAPLSDDTVLYPGHLYSAEPSAALGEVRRDNYVLAPATSEQWLRMFAS